MNVVQRLISQTAIVLNSGGDALVLSTQTENCAIKMSKNVQLYWWFRQLKKIII